MNIYKATLITLGTISLALGFIGIFVPVLPTTPFLLLTAALYIRGSDRLYNLLISSRLFGSYIKNFRRKNGMSKKLKINSIIIMWLTILISFYLVEITYIRILLISLGLTGTAVMGFVIKTVED